MGGYMPCSNDGGSERLCVRASLMIFAIGSSVVGGTNYGVVGWKSSHVLLVRGEREEAVGDEANFKLKLHQLYTMFGILVGPCSSFDR